MRRRRRGGEERTGRVRKKLRGERINGGTLHHTSPCFSPSFSYDDHHPGRRLRRLRDRAVDHRQQCRPGGVGRPHGMAPPLLNTPSPPPPLPCVGGGPDFSLCLPLDVRARVVASTTFFFWVPLLNSVSLSRLSREKGPSGPAPSLPPPRPFSPSHDLRRSQHSPRRRGRSARDALRRRAAAAGQEPSRPAPAHARRTGRGRRIARGGRSWRGRGGGRRLGSRRERPGRRSDTGRRGRGGRGDGRLPAVAMAPPAVAGPSSSAGASPRRRCGSASRSWWRRRASSSRAAAPWRRRATPTARPTAAAPRAPPERSRPHPRVVHHATRRRQDPRVRVTRRPPSPSVPRRSSSSPLPAPSVPPARTPPPILLPAGTSMTMPHRSK